MAARAGAMEQMFTLLHRGDQRVAGPNHDSHGAKLDCAVKVQRRGSMESFGKWVSNEFPDITVVQVDSVQDAVRGSDDEVVILSVGGMPAEDLAWGTTLYRKAVEPVSETTLPPRERPAPA